MKMKKSVIIMLALMMILGTLTVQAEQLGETEIVVTSDPIQLKVTVPIKMPVHLNTDGTVTTADNLYIQNLSAAGGVVVKDIQLTTRNGWELKDFDYADYKNLPVNSKIYGFQIFNDNAEELTGKIGLTSTEWGVIPSAGLKTVNDVLGNITYEDNKEATENRLNLVYDAKAGAQSAVVAETAVGGIVFTIDFNYVE